MIWGVPPMTRRGEIACLCCTTSHSRRQIQRRTEFQIPGAFTKPLAVVPVPGGADSSLINPRPSIASSSLSSLSVTDAPTSPSTLRFPPVLVSLCSSIPCISIQLGASQQHSRFVLASFCRFPIHSSCPFGRCRRRDIWPTPEAAYRQLLPVRTSPAATRRLHDRTNQEGYSIQK